MESNRKGTEDKMISQLAMIWAVQLEILVKGLIVSNGAMDNLIEARGSGCNKSFPITQSHAAWQPYLSLSTQVPY